MGAETFATAPADSKRAVRRSRVLLSAKLRTPTGMIEGRLRDMSRKGALIECATMPPAGTDVTFERGKIRVPAKIAWAANGRIGLEFRYIIDESELLVHIGQTREPAASPHRFGRAALTLGMSAGERKAARTWSVTVGLTLPEQGD